MPARATRNPKLLFLAAAVILVAVGVWGVVAALRSIDDSEWVLHTADVQRLLDDVATLERQAVAAQRGYLLVDDAALRDEFWDAKARLQLRGEALVETINDPTSSPKARELQQLLARRMELALGAIGRYERDGLPAARAYIASNGSLDIDRRVVALHGELRARERELMARRRGQLDRSTGGSLLATALGIPISLLLLFAVNRLLVRQSAERQLVADAAETSAGEYRKLSGDMAALSRFVGMVQSCETVDELLAVTAQGFSALAPELAGTVYLLRASRDHAEAASGWGRHAAPSDSHPEPGDCWALRRNQPYSCPDVAGGVPCPHVNSMVDGTASTLCLPLTAQGVALGWITLERAGAASIGAHDLVQQAAEQMSLALANLRLQQDLRNQSIRDPLTGLFNRRYLEESLAREIARCARRELPLAVLMFDVDHFKAFNDRHGHPGGDALLAAFGHLLRAHCRPEDIPCRFGGEEFTLILPEASLEVAQARAEAIRDATARLQASHHGVALSRVTTSIGLAMLPVHGATAAELVAAADKALYRAKAGGRNRVAVAEAPATGG